MKNYFLSLLIVFASRFVESSQPKDTSKNLRPESNALVQMNVLLDKRLIDLKKTDPKAFKAEMAIQKNFNDAVKNFCSYYEKHCDGSVCSMCIKSCFSAFYSYRMQQAKEINTSSLYINAEKLPVDITRKIFSSFADSLCQMPESIWLKSSRPKPCSDKILSDIQSKVVLTMTASSENEGDVCAQLSN